MEPVHIRPAAAADVAIIAAHNREMALQTEGKELDPATVEAGVRAVLADPRRGFYLLAERAGRVVGQLMVTPEWSDWRAAEFWWLQSVYVEPEARRLGIFQALFEHLRAEARSRGGVCGLRLYTEQGNLVAQRTYRALGMGEARYRMYELDL